MQLQRSDPHLPNGATEFLDVQQHLELYKQTRLSFPLPDWVDSVSANAPSEQHKLQDKGNVFEVLVAPEEQRGRRSLLRGTYCSRLQGPGAPSGATEHN